MSFFVDDSGKLRSGWVVALFSALAAGGYAVGQALISLLGLYPRQPLSLDDGYLFFSTTALLAAAGGPTLICALALKAEVGLPRKRAGKHLLLGLALGAALVALAVLVPIAVGQGALSLTAASAPALVGAGLKQLAILAPTSIGEELLLRGVALRALAKGTQPAVAVALTGSAFGLMHLLNPDATGLAALNVALVGLWFGALALRTSLWASIAAHVAWNWFEGFVFGQPVSGIDPGSSLLLGAIRPSGFFSGGDFGPEASGLTALLLVTATAATALWPKKA